MGDFRSNNREGRSSGNRFRGRGGFGDRPPRFEGRNRGFGGREGGRSDRGSQMHRVTCDRCNNECEVPFRPTGDKPVYCNDCFRKGESSQSRNSDKSTQSNNISNDQFQQLNFKLDRILKILQELELDVEEESEEEEEDDEEEK